MAVKAKPKTNKSSKTKSKPKAKPKTATKKTKATKPRKTVDVFADSKEVSQKQAELKALEQERKGLEQSIKEIIDTYNSKSANNRDAERFLDKLPLDSLRELQDFMAGKKKESNLDILKLRAKLRKDRNKKIDEINKMDEKISEGQIDLILAKIYHVIGKVDSKKE